jgi:sialate O-acetylesterase
MKKQVLLLMLSLTFMAQAEVQLNGMFTDHMVLQRNQLVPVWGTADPGEQVIVEFAGQKQSATAKQDGSWMAHLNSMKASSSPQMLSVRSSIGNQRSAIDNILVGDVWLCSGQSNMAQTMKRYLIWDQVKDSFSNDQVRLFKIKEGGVGSPEPSKELVIDPFFKNSWQACMPEFAAEFSATAGFFGMKLQQDIDVPIGLLYANRGGTQANMWMPREVLESNPDYARFLDASNGNWKPSKNNPDAIRSPSHLYNGTIHPLAPFAIRGAIWYQGESDSQHSELYESLMKDLIASWRREWGYDFPFLYVQLAPYNVVNWEQLGEGWAWLRDAQLQTLKSVPNTGMVVITDGGEAKDIHPQAKNLPGERLAILAAALDDPQVNADFPTVGKMQVKGGKVLLKFNGVSSGLNSKYVAQNREKGHLPGKGPKAEVAEADDLKGFSICGADQQFVKAQAKIVSKNSVLVSAAEVKDPLAVRYGWSNFPLCNLYGGNGMPASPFRTDDFPMPNLTGEKLGKSFDGIQTGWGSTMELLNAGDGTFQTLEVDGMNAWKADGSYLYSRVPDLNEPMGAKIHLLYFDEGFAAIELRYDSSSGPWTSAGEVKCKNYQQWKVASFELPDARFSKRCNGGDIRLQSNGSLTLGGIYLQLEVK